MDKELKEKIVNTIKHHEDKCHEMKNEIQHLRIGISELARLQDGLNSDLENQVSFFHEVIKEGVEPIRIQKNLSAVVSTINSLLKKKEQTFDNSDNICFPRKVNTHLTEFIHYLIIPPELNKQLLSIENKLKIDLNSSLLIQVIEEIKNLVLELFGREQHQFKFLLEHISHHLLQVNDSIKKNFDYNHISRINMHQLEDDIQGTLDDIQSTMHDSNSFEDFSYYLQDNLSSISSQINTFRKIEESRLQLYEDEIKQLEKKLADFEQKNNQIKQELDQKNIQLNTDALTKIANRHFYNITIQKAYARWQATGEQLTLAIADIDHFKKINDQFGHLTGDKVLERIAAILQESLHSNDFLARYGGEEFAIIFEGLAIDYAQKKLEELRLNIENFHFLYQGNRIPITVSFGLTSIGQGDNIDSLFKRADEALYKAKNNGRNQIVALCLSG